jgi:hypothetical protein
MSSFDDWLSTGTLFEADWSGHLVGLGARGELGRIGRSWLLDLPALTAPYGCRSRECTPGLRAPRARSCCADLAVGLAPGERAAIEAAQPRIALHMRGRDPRWHHQDPPMFEEDGFARPGRRCVMARMDPGGMRCALHEIEDQDGLPRGTLKPMPCRLFPLFVVELGGGRRLLSAVHKRSAEAAGSYPARMYPCLRDPNRKPLYRACRDTMLELFGPRTYASLRREASGWLRRTRAGR